MGEFRFPELESCPSPGQGTEHAKFEQPIDRPAKGLKPEEKETDVKIKNRFATHEKPPHLKKSLKKKKKTVDDTSSRTLKKKKKKVEDSSSSSSSSALAQSAEVLRCQLYQSHGTIWPQQRRRVRIQPHIGCVNTRSFLQKWLVNVTSTGNGFINNHGFVEVQSSQGAKHISGIQMGKVSASGSSSSEDEKKTTSASSSARPARILPKSAEGSEEPAKAARCL